MGNKIIVSGLALFFFITTGCGQDLPFEYRYLSANLVQIKYLDKVYELNRYGDNNAVPFKFQFESDGDLDITISGKTYDIDSPYDIDKPKVTKKKKKSSKKTRSKKKK